MLFENIRLLFLWVCTASSFFLLSCSTPQPAFVCKDSLGCVNIGPDDPLKIGVLQALSGKVAPLGQAQVRGLELALDTREQHILGYKVKLQVEDTGCSSEGGANAALKIIADPQTVAIFGTTCSGAAATASKAMSAANLTMISGNNSAPFLTSIAGEAAPNNHAGFFRTAPNEENAGKAAAGYVFKKLGLRRAAVIHDNDIYTKGLAQSFQLAFRELGGEVVLATSINKGDREMGPVLKAVINSGAQLLFFPLFQPEGNHILLQARTLDAFKNILLISDGALIEKSFLQAVGDTAKGMCFVGPKRPQGEAVDALAAAYEKKYGQKPTVSYYLSAFDAATLLFDAIEKAAVKDSDNTLHIGRQALREQLHAISGHQGVSGTLGCDRFGDCKVPEFNVLRLDDPALGLEGLEANVVHSWNQSE